MVRGSQMNYEKYADAIPELGHGGRTVKTLLMKYSEKVHPDNCIVETGPFLGSATSYLATGILRHDAPRPRIYCIDPWVASPEYMDKAERFLGIKFKQGEDLLPMFKSSISFFPVEYTAMKRRFETFTEWNGEKIELFVMDSGHSEEQMRVFDAIFLPHFIPKKTVVIFMDFYFYEGRGENRGLYETQKRYVEEKAKTFKGIERKDKAAVYRYCG